MKVLFIVPYPTEGPSNRFRVEQYLMELEKREIRYTVRPFCNSGFYKILFKNKYVLKKIFYLIFFSLSRIIDIFRSLSYDVVFIHREAFPTKDYLFEVLFRIFGRKVIYDFDDSIFLKKYKKVRKTITMADYVITGNSFLESYALALNGKVEVIPTSIDTDKYRPAAKIRRNSNIIIGWIGTPTTSSYLLEIKDVFSTLINKYKNIEFRTIGAEFSVVKDLPVINKPWYLHTEIQDLQEFDIGIMPMPDNNWTKGKCAFKIVQYMSMEIPVVASPVGMNNEVIKDGVNGFLAASDKEWIEKLSLLIENRKLRERLGKNGRVVVEERYSLDINAPKFLKVIQKVYQDKS